MVRYMTKIITLKFKIIIGVVLFVILICATYCASFFNTISRSSNKNNYVSGQFVYNGTFLTPVENFICVTSKYGKREAHGVVSANHTGIDLCGSIGSRVMSVKDGQVTWAGWQKYYGNCVEIKHINENGTIYYTFYAHMRDDSICVKNGQIVTEGQIIGTQGSTGNSTGDHLHFEIRLEDKSTIDPAPYLFNET